MNKIYSKKNQSRLLHLVIRKKNIKKKRFDISDPKEFLQVASFSLKKNQTFDAHYHIWNKNKKTRRIAQESWVVISGSVRALYYDLDSKYICSRILKAGDISVTYYGGHNYVALKNNTLIYEFKTGPYEGQKKDKKFIFKNNI